MAEPPATPSARPAKPARRQIVTRVESVERLTPGMLRIVVAGDDLAGFGAGAFSDHYVKLVLPPAGAPYAPPFDPEQLKAELPREQWPRMRTYTVRAWEPDANRLTLDFVVHGDEGLAGPWAAAAQPGDLLQLVGPGGSYTPDPSADWHLFVGDASVIPAIQASLPRVAAGVPVRIVLQVDGPQERQPLVRSDDPAVEVVWLHDAAHGAEQFVDALRALEFPPGRVHAFVHGEATAVREVRRHLVLERGVAREQLSASGYWKLTRSDEDWRAEKAEWNRLVEADEAAA
ncbi:siderophore-interacting protein [Conexibacter sp. JD483]|uniref:siderophore-interacting protein n=1 Tax=unclassified Conexibacter TaxID=2627773 RepID=UPI00271ECCBE|nr:MULTISPECIES: siderophore-interacting protein [unclassified Conexibacter]MDO8187469.1 siderophore-interacting protein [Conexibacter sp. CPCC 205706]MDO8198703.1 siderophore-interacting protein [Conexibacter sp. CPCC 205762]MDR9369881.1 siderophore-interacting protein [Conexibacter sp. JD483]